MKSPSNGSGHASSSIAQPEKGTRRGSIITPEQLALMNAVMPISSMEEKNAENDRRRRGEEQDDDDDDEEDEEDLESDYDEDD